MKALFGRWTYYALAVLLLPVTACTTLPETLEPAGEDISFVVVGDVQQGYGIFSQLAIHIGNLTPIPCATIFLGDYMAKPGLEIEWLNFWGYAAPIVEKMPVYLVRGNHEGNSPEDNRALRRYGHFPEGPFYRTVRVEELLFVLLDTHEEGNGNRIPETQRQWLTEQLSAAGPDTTIHYIFIFMHHPLYPQGFHKGNGLWDADEIHRLFRQHPKIRILFSGHEHRFHRLVKEELNYIISGGGGAYLHHGYGGDYHHFVKVSIIREVQQIRIQTIGVFHETVADFNL